MYDDENVLITIDELCDMLMIGRSTAYRLLKSGQIRCFRINKIWKIPRNAVAQYIEQQCSR